MRISVPSPILQPALAPVPGGGERRAFAEGDLRLPAQIAGDRVVGADPVALAHLGVLVAVEGDGATEEAAVALADEGGGGERPLRRGQAQRLAADGLLDGGQEVAPGVDGPVVQEVGGGRRVVAGGGRQGGRAGGVLRVDALAGVRSVAEEWGE